MESSDEQSLASVYEGVSSMELSGAVDAAVQNILPAIKELLEKLESRLVQEMQMLRPCSSLPEGQSSEPISPKKVKSKAEADVAKKSPALLPLQRVSEIREKSGNRSPKKGLTVPLKSSPKNSSSLENLSILPNEVCQQPVPALSRANTGGSALSKSSAKNSLNYAPSVRSQNHASLEKLMKRVDDAHISDNRGLSAQRTSPSSEATQPWAHVRSNTHHTNLTSSDQTCQILSDQSRDLSVSNTNGHASYLQTLVDWVSAAPSPTISRCQSNCSRPSIHRGMTIEDMREGRQDELVAMALPRAGTDTSEVLVPIWLYFAGVLPLRACTGNGLASRVPCLSTRIVNLLILAGIIVYCSLQLFNAYSGDACHDAVCIEDVLSPLLAMAVGCLLRLLSLCFSDDQLLGSETVSHHVKSLGVVHLWTFHSRVDMAKIFCCWFCMLAAAAFVSVGWNLEHIHIAMFILISGFVSQIFMAMALSMVHTCRGLTLSIDDFCSKIVDEQNCDNAVENWNILQAILRRVCTTVARSFTVLLTSSLVATFLPAILANDSMAMLPGAFTLFALLWVSLFIGGVTSKCDRVPSFINMMHFGENFDHRRQYVVDYIINSRAGFYMFDVRVTGELVVKSAYVFCVLAAAFVTRMLSASGSD